VTMPSRSNGPVRVLLVDSSPLALAVMKRCLDLAPDVVVVGTARNGKEALELVPRLDPQVICTDLYMPQMGGLEFVQAVMEQYPRPILVVTAVTGPDLTRLLEAGALDHFAKTPALTGSPGTAAEEESVAQLIRRIRLLAGVPVMTRRSRSGAPSAPASTWSRPRPAGEGLDGALRRSPVSVLPKIVAVGASTGGPQVLKAIFSDLPPAFPVPQRLR